MALTDLKCKAAKPDLKPYKLSDGEGMYLEVMPSEAKYWRLKYRFHGKEKHLALGAYPTISLAEARDKKIEAKRQIRDGIDPSAARQELKRKNRIDALNTFEVVAREWYDRHHDTWSERHALSIIHRLKLDVFPELGNIPVVDIKPLDIVRCVRNVESRNALEMARRAKQMCNQVLSYAVETGYIERNVVLDLGKNLIKKRRVEHYSAIEVNQLPALVAALETNEARLFKQTRLATKLLMLTFVRTTELIEATWDEFDLEEKTWLIPAKRMKMRRDHVVPLSDQAVEIHIYSLSSKLISYHSEATSR
jgi:integrase